MAANILNPGHLDCDPRVAPPRVAAIAATGVALPATRRTNTDFASMLDTSDSWIVERTGIRERRVAGPGESTATLAIDAARAALDAAQCAPGDVDLLIVATATPEQPVPATSAFVHEGLDLRCGAFDVNAACAGFVYGLVSASALVGTGAVDTVLLIGAETLTRIVDPGDRATAVLFGDGAGAVVLRPAGKGHGLLGWDLGCDGTAVHLLEVRAGGSRLPASATTVAAGAHYLTMEGREVFRRAVRAVVESASAALARAGLGACDVDVFVPHQANARIIEAAATRLGINPDRTVVNIDRYGNTSAASIPIALAEATASGRLVDGDVVLLSGFGAGMTWASAVLTWGAA